MSSANVPSTSSPPSARDLIVTWLFNQGASTVILIGILYAVYVKSDTVISKIDTGYSRNLAEMREITRVQAETVDKIISQWREDRAIYLGLIRDASEKYRSSQPEAQE
jgi:hypothetical protein